MKRITLEILAKLLLRNSKETDGSSGRFALPVEYKVFYKVGRGVPAEPGAAFGALFIVLQLTPLIKLLAGKARECRWPMYLVCVAFILYFICIRQ